MDFRDRRVLVVGTGISGLAAIEALLPRGADIAVCDKKQRDAIVRSLPLDLADKIEILDSYPRVNKTVFDLLVVSPGISLDIAPIVQAFAQDIPVISEVELAYLIKPPAVQIYAITGTNGKTTTTTLLQKILLAAGQQACAGGNIGAALTTVVDRMSAGIAVAEISSFQLETTSAFRPHICSLLNITPDHVDRHKTMENYIKTKSKIFANQTAEDYAIFNYEDAVLRQLSEECPARAVFFSTQREIAAGAFIKDNMVMVRFDDSERPVCRIDEILLRGKHNQENILCAAAMATVAGIEPQHIAATLKTFKGVRHRMEEVAAVEEVLYVNDSKGTNPESSIKAIESFDNPIVLIAGGRNKGSRFDLLAQVIKSRVKELILLGEAKDDIKSSVMMTGFTNIYEVKDLPAAVGKAHKLAPKGGVVLLSPACASWDMFDNYEQRGDLFCDAVHSLNQNHSRQ